jgi:hypothetical protein
VYPICSLLHSLNSYTDILFISSFTSFFPEEFVTVIRSPDVHIVLHLSQKRVFFPKKRLRAKREQCQSCRVHNSGSPCSREQHPDPDPRSSGVILIVRLHFSSIVSLYLTIIAELFAPSPGRPRPRRGKERSLCLDLSRRKTRRGWQRSPSRRDLTGKSKSTGTTIHPSVISSLASRRSAGRSWGAFVERDGSQFRTEKKIPGGILARTYSTPSSPAREPIQV